MCSLEYFYKNDKNKLDGLYPECKECSKKKSIESRIRNREGWLASCIKRNAKPDIKQIMRETAKRQRERGDQKEWRQKNKERVRELAKNHRIHDVSTKEEYAMLKVFGFKCAYCGMTLEEHKKLHRQKLHNDHVDHEGYNDLRNDVCACKSCNSKKHDFDMETWYREQDFFSEGKLDFIKWWISEGYKDYIEEKLPYRILRKKNEDDNKFHWELWSVNEKRNLIECILKKPKKKDLQEDINIYIRNAKQIKENEKYKEVINL